MRRHSAVSNLGTHEDLSQERFKEIMKKEDAERSAMTGCTLGLSDKVSSKPDLLDIPCVDGADCTSPSRSNLRLYEKNAAHCDPSSPKSLEIVRMRRHSAVSNVGTHEDLKFS